ncbi:MAG: response regulator transcription factor [Candidatus Dormibacteraeota bacterium]|nr:response regulator transcription factor [Candidatus Dormibacteraeota bacterium]
MKLLDALPVGVAMLEPAPPFRCIYVNAMFGLWRWRGPEPRHGALLEGLLSPDVRDSAVVMQRALDSGTAQLLTADDPGQPEPLTCAVVCALHGTLKVPTALLITTVGAIDELLMAGVRAGLLPPFAEVELQGVSTAPRQTTPAEQGVRGVELEGVTTDVNRQVVTRDGVERRLTWTEWQLFTHLVDNAGTTLRREQLARILWGEAGPSRVNEVDVYISRVRRKVEQNPRRPRVIETVRGEGYRVPLRAVKTGNDTARNSKLSVL